MIQRLLVALCDACEGGLLVTFEDTREEAIDAAVRFHRWSVTRELRPDGTAIVLRCPACTATGQPARG